MRKREVRMQSCNGDLVVRTRNFALRIVELFRALPRSEESRVIGRQILRSGTSVGANYRAACRSRSRAEFISKLGLVLEEVDETVYWLELLRESRILPPSRLCAITKEANELTAIFVASLRTPKAVSA